MVSSKSSQQRLHRLLLLLLRRCRALNCWRRGHGGGSVLEATDDAHHCVAKKQANFPRVSEVGVGENIQI